jgi:hypothetical protein
MSDDTSNKVGKNKDGNTMTKMVTEAAGAKKVPPKKAAARRKTDEDLINLDTPPKEEATHFQCALLHREKGGIHRQPLYPRHQEQDQRCAP